ncbi:GDCCVxC domain-containing (seleno)protein [Hyphobacterium marinum]|jgi:hypothetical protein|uniref:GDCCVxC domain-containing (Seleno)protein n=1 Tax=Hyphobacterium marinum TaxID=3116574 RepID=A0ABU7LV34_9PROT|nr:GDCCVxC domain-containing (seleno)protein [Hyphobacterium sp. Y6023]MEE2565112.1 GDCCVxC domain-containing (seleno)protein [Hyphobacterium sp. Y6023]
MSDQQRLAMEMNFKSTLTCPECETIHPDLLMPTDACQYFWDCPSCKMVIKPLDGDCCVFCSYGSVACPPIQSGTCCE